MIGGISAGRRGRERTIEIAGQIVARQCFDQNLLDDAVAILDTPEDLRMQIVLRKQREQSGGRENLACASACLRASHSASVVNDFALKCVSVLGDFGVARSPVRESELVPNKRLRVTQPIAWLVV